MWVFFHQKAYDVNAEKAFNYNGMFNVHLCIHNTHCCYIPIHEKKKVTFYYRNSHWHYVN